MKRFMLIAIGLLANPVCADIVVTDFEKREVRLAEPAKRIVALAPHIVENMFSAGAGQQLVGVVSYSDYPQQAKDIPQVGTYKSWSLEAIAALQPDLILMWSSGNGLDQLPTLTGLGIPVYVSELRQLDDIPRSIRNIAALAGTLPDGEFEAARLEREINNLRRVYANRESLDVFYQVWDEPLVTIGGDHMISRILELCGARNVFSDAVSLAPKISLESVLERNPDAIVASGMAESRPDWLDNWKQYAWLDAARADAFFFVQPDHIQRPTARILTGATRICQQLDTVRKPVDALE